MGVGFQANAQTKQ